MSLGPGQSWQTAKEQRTECDSHATVLQSQNCCSAQSALIALFTPAAVALPEHPHTRCDTCCDLAYTATSACSVRTDRPQVCMTAATSTFAYTFGTMETGRFGMPSRFSGLCVLTFTLSDKRGAVDGYRPRPWYRHFLVERILSLPVWSST